MYSFPFCTIRPVTVSVHVDMNFAPVAVRIESHGRREKDGEAAAAEEEEVEAARRLVAGRDEDAFSLGAAIASG